jgi:hypothetical protein
MSTFRSVEIVHDLPPSKNLSEVHLKDCRRRDSPFLREDHGDDFGGWCDVRMSERDSLRRPPYAEGSALLIALHFWRT